MELPHHSFSLQTHLEICGPEVSHLCNAVGFSVGPITFSYSCNWILIIQPMQCHYMNMTLLLELSHLKGGSQIEDACRASA